MWAPSHSPCPVPTTSACLITAPRSPASMEVPGELQLYCFSSVWPVPLSELGTNIARSAMFGTMEWLDGPPPLSPQLFLLLSSRFSASRPRLVTCRAQKTKWSESLDFSVTQKPFGLATVTANSPKKDDLHQEG